MEGELHRDRLRLALNGQLAGGPAMLPQTSRPCRKRKSRTVMIFVPL
jgi:hypothetical protein